MIDRARALARGVSYANGHFFADTTKEEKKLVVVGRPSLAAISVGGRGRPPHCTEARPTKLFSYYVTKNGA